MKTELTAEEKERDEKLKAEVAKDFKKILPQIRPKQWGFWTMQEVHNRYKEIAQEFYHVEPEEGYKGYTRFRYIDLDKNSMMREEYEKWLKNTLNKRRITAGTWNKVVEVFGVWVVCKNGSIDYGSHEAYSIPPDWHKEKQSYWVPHVMRKNMSEGNELDLLRAFAYSAKMQGLDEFEIGTDIW